MDIFLLQNAGSHATGRRTGRTGGFRCSDDPGNICGEHLRGTSAVREAAAAAALPVKQVTAEVRL